MTQPRIASLVHSASTAASAGNWQDAERLWTEVRALDPSHVQALFSLGVHAYQRADFAKAVEFLHSAQQAAPRDPMIPLTMSVVYRDAQQPELEWAALIESLSIDPYFLPALLSKGEALVHRGQPRAAAAVFRDVLKVAPPEPQWSPALQRRLVRARDAVQQDSSALAAYLHQHVVAEQAILETPLRSRWDEAISIFAGQSKPYRSECSQLHVPRLPALGFYENALFPWIEELQAQTAAIKAELEQLLAERQDDFTPYIAYKPGDPVNQWRALNHSRAWSSLHLWAHGAPVQVNVNRCPRTAEALSKIEAVQIAGLCPNAMFSALAPRTVIPPHTGETNARLVAHLPLIVPPHCTFRVGHEWRTWRQGEVLVFDDTIEHEARNDSDELRVVLIFDVWNPLLSHAERAMVSALSSAMRDYRSGQRV